MVGSDTLREIKIATTLIQDIGVSILIKILSTSYKFASLASIRVWCGSYQHTFCIEGILSYTPSSSTKNLLNFRGISWEDL